ncbi:MAG TPA: alpha-amylase family glycosyl hydrolase [Terriglobales bacterium]|nr:alpha-amylase family glycosyl hydrolase [Terriglobales bacterium]
MLVRPTFEFHVSRSARERYDFSHALFSVTGNVVFADLSATREFAHKMNVVRGAEKDPARAVNPGALNAMGLIDETLHLLIAQYREQLDPRAILDALTFFEARLGRDALDKTLLAFTEQFPPVAVYRGELGIREWFGGSTNNIPNRAIAFEELMMLWLANANPAFKPFAELFDDRELVDRTAYSRIISGLREYFETRPKFGPEAQNLVDLLRAPALASPDSLSGQLAFIRDKWVPMLRDFVRRFLTAIDVLKEEEVAIWLRFHPPVDPRHGGPGWDQRGDSSEAAIPHYPKVLKQSDYEYEAFSPDVDWMPRTVMVAKSTYVWLDQLSQAYGRHIHKLNHIPNEELDTMARRGFNALWLIGLWERSHASQRIKQMCGNPDAVASAYSLLDYTIAEDLGGEAAYNDLRERAAARGIRLASDMVPNHMGIDSRWVMEHPDWFLSLPHPPYPAYSFNGPDVSHDGRVEIKIEDHYYDRTDAAVVFRRVDRWSGDTRYIYHGNDGTSFPWNDTAQLNYLKAEVREGVIQTILHVARMFPIIRFDAAMTLTKLHYQRLWFPQPGTGGAIPSRAEHGLTKEEFDRLMPTEFWRELVDRVAAEVPGTLLLAEAFWLLEGYFVRTLGMHRVYNSAFMNMMRDEENANYRSVIKNTLEFDPEVLKRYVNFMNNPDERTAVDQFGKGDKYFGVCTVMATLPGLPMFGHGQVEGFSEKYGMEFRRAYKQETPDPWLIARHEREISPLLHRRALFAEVENFLLYDFYTDSGHVNEDVYAFSNRRGDDRALVVFNNRYADTRGWIRQSAAYMDKNSKALRQQTVGESFGIQRGDDKFVAFRDAMNGLEYLHRSREVAEKGLHIELGAYRCNVFLDWREMRDDGSRPLAELCNMLAGRGVSSLEDSLRDLELQPIHSAVRALLDPEVVRAFATPAISRKPGRKTSAAVEHVVDLLHPLLKNACHYGASPASESAGFGPGRKWSGNEKASLTKFRSRLDSARHLDEVVKHMPGTILGEIKSVLPVEAVEEAALPLWGSVIAATALEAIGDYCNEQQSDAALGQLFDALRLREVLAQCFERLGMQGDERWRASARVRATFAHSAWAPSTRPQEKPAAAPLAWMHDPEMAWLIGAHEWEGFRYFNKELFERLLWWMSLRSLLDLASQPLPDNSGIQVLAQEIGGRMNAASEAGYRVESLLMASTAKTLPESFVTASQATETTAPKLAKTSTIKKKSTKKRPTKN